MKIDLTELENKDIHILSADRVGVGNPNGNQSGVKGLSYLDVPHAKLWICVTSGTTLTAVWKCIYTVPPNVSYGIRYSTKYVIPEYTSSELLKPKNSSTIFRHIRRSCRAFIGNCIKKIVGVKKHE